MNENELIKRTKQVEELENTINDLNAKLKESESLKSNFISNIMNEVYNPFSSIISMADNILSLDADNLQKAIPMAEIIYREAAQLDFQLQNIFAAASIEAGVETLEVSNVNIHNIFESIKKKFQFDIVNNNLTISSNTNERDEINFVTDSKKLTLILLNLLSNSIKHSPPNTLVNFNFEVIGNYLNITIADQGPGMSKTDIELIFDRFKRIDTTINSVTGGAGLGLSVVKALTEILNANINIESNNGTHISLAIPKLELSDDDDTFEDDALLFDEEIF